MKKMILLISLSILLALVLTASNARSLCPSFIHGKGDWHPTLCSSPDHISIISTFRYPTIYLVGEDFPSHGQWIGCHIDAWGTMFTNGTCRYMEVNEYNVICPASINR